MLWKLRFVHRLVRHALEHLLPRVYLAPFHAKTNNDHIPLGTHINVLPVVTARHKIVTPVASHAAPPHVLVVAHASLVLGIDRIAETHHAARMPRAMIVRVRYSRF